MFYVNYNIFIFVSQDILQKTKTTAASILKRQATKSVDELKMSVCLIFEIAISQFFPSRPVKLYDGIFTF